MQKAKRVGRPRAEDVERRVEQLLDVATELFVQQGYSETSIDALATTAKVGKQTIYSRFPDKQSLFLEVVRRSMNARSKEITPVLSEDTPISQGLRQWANYILRSALRTPFLQLYKLLLSEGPRFPEIAETFVSISSARYADPLQQYFQMIREQNEVFFFSPQDAARIFLYLMNGYIIRYALEGWKRPTLKEIDFYAVEASHVLLYGLQAHSQTGKKRKP